MKVQKITQEQKFTPVELRITIQSQEEYSLFYNLMWHSTSVPREVYVDEPEQQELLSKMMQSIIEYL